MTDLRDVRGRLLRLVISTVLGLGTSFLVAMGLPTRDHFERMHCCICGTGFIREGDSFFIMLAGAVGAALAWYALLSCWARWSRRPRLPRATLLK